MKYLAGPRLADGRWRGYWWWDDEYMTALAAEACPRPGAARVAWASVRVTRDRRGPQRRRGTFAVGDGLVPADAAAEATAALSGRHAGARHDGSGTPRTPTEAGLRPRVSARAACPRQVDAAAPARRLEALDHRRVFTTAAVVAALPGD